MPFWSQARTCHALAAHRTWSPRAPVDRARGGHRSVSCVGKHEDLREEWRLALMPCAFHGAWHVACLGFRA